MSISEIITPDRIKTGQAVQSKKKALEEISALLASGTPYLTETEIFTSLVNREKLGSTAVGDGIAIPHGRVGVESAIGACVILDEGVDFEANDDKPVDVLFGLLVPEDANETHLKILASLAEMSMQDDFGSRIRSLAEAEDVHNLLAKLTTTEEA